MNHKEIVDEVGKKLDFIRTLDHQTRQAMISRAKQAIAGKEGGVHLLPWKIRQLYIPILSCANVPSKNFARRMFYAKLNPDKLIEDFQLFCNIFLPKVEDRRA